MFCDKISVVDFRKKVCVIFCTTYTMLHCIMYNAYILNGKYMYLDLDLYHSGFSSLHCNNVKKYCILYTNLWIVLV